MRPAISKDCLLCRYCYADVHGELKCLFLFEMMMFHKITPSVNCPKTKDS